MNGTLEVGLTADETMVIMNHPQIDQDERGGHIIFSPQQARELAELLLKKAGECHPVQHEAKSEAKTVVALSAAVDAQIGTITTLCNRIDHINIICHDRVMPIEEKLRQVEEWSDGFSHPPAEKPVQKPFMSSRALLDQAITAMQVLHAAAEPVPDHPEPPALIPANHFRSFVDIHAQLLYDRAHLPEETLFQAHTSAVNAFLTELAEYLGLNGPTAKPSDFIARAANIRQWCADHQTPLDFTTALKIAEDVFEKYKKEQLKWWKRMDGTPILNDVAVRMAIAFRDAARLPTEI